MKLISVNHDLEISGVKLPELKFFPKLTPVQLVKLAMVKAQELKEV
jgi:hypothetical protein